MVRGQGRQCGVEATGESEAGMECEFAVVGTGVAAKRGTERLGQG